MHELPIIARVLDLATASAPPGSDIVRIRLRVGYLCDAEPLWLERYFRIAARRTPAERAELVVTREAGPAAAGAAAGAAGAKAGAPHGAAGTPPAAGASGPDRSAADAAFGYVLESIEVRDAPRRNEP